MKNKMLVVGLAMANLAFANTENTSSESAEKPELENTLPKMILEVYDLSTNEPKLIPGRAISRTNKNHYLCWTTENVNAQKENFIIEQFVSPIAMKWTDAAGNEAQRDKNKVKHTLVGNINSLQGNLVEKCWQFTQKHPRGEYSFSLRVNDIAFPEQKFQVVK